MTGRIEEFHTVKGTRLEVVRLPAGRASGKPPIMLLHEGLGSVSMWKEFPEQLAAVTGAEVIAYSRAGYGRSGRAALPRTAHYMHDEGLDVLPQLIDSLEIERPVLFGHSDGASIAVICAGGTDVLLSGLILMAPHLFVEQIAVDSIVEAAKVWHATDLRERLGRYHDDVEAAFVGWNDIWLSPEFLQWNIEAYLPGIKVPVLAIQGEDDEYGSMTQIDAIAENLPDTQLLKLPGCRHSPHKDQTDRVLTAVTHFLESQVASRLAGLRG